MTLTTTPSPPLAGSYTLPGDKSLAHRAALFAALAEGDHACALKLQQRANAVTQALLTVNFGGALYETMSLLGFDCGQPRLPGMVLSADEKQGLRANLEAAGFWDVVNMS